MKGALSFLVLAGLVMTLSAVDFNQRFRTKDIKSLVTLKTDDGKNTGIDAGLLKQLMHSKKRVPPHGKRAQTTSLKTDENESTENDVVLALARQLLHLERYNRNVKREELANIDSLTKQLLLRLARRFYHEPNKRGRQEVSLQIKTDDDGEVAKRKSEIPLDKGQDLSKDGDKLSGSLNSNPKTGDAEAVKNEDTLKSDDVRIDPRPTNLGRYGLTKYGAEVDLAGQLISRKRSGSGKGGQNTNLETDNPVAAEIDAELAAVVRQILLSLSKNQIYRMQNRRRRQQGYRQFNDGCEVAKRKSEIPSDKRQDLSKDDVEIAKRIAELALIRRFWRPIEEYNLPW